MTFDDPADAWAAYCFETPRDRRSPQGALAFGFHAAPSHDADLVKALEAALPVLRGYDFPGAHPHRRAVYKECVAALAAAKDSASSRSTGEA